MDNKEVSEKVKNELTIEQVYEVVAMFGGNPMIKGNIIISQTICHGGQSNKLYYYDNTKLFRCYTECSDTFDIFELVLKVKNHQQGLEWSLPQAVSYIAQYFNIYIPTEEFGFSHEELEDWKTINRYEKNDSLEINNKIVEYKIWDSSILKYLPRPKILPWLKEGITQEAMDYSGICYDPVSQGIVIPHYNENGELIGIRERTLIKENEENGKYKPAILNYKMYNHPLGFNLYNLNNSKNNIKLMKKAFVFEGEKSCLLYQSYFGIDNDISVAVCGSNLINHQVQLLKQAGVEEIVVSFDKQFKKIGDDEWKAWTKKLIDINNKYSKEVQISFLFDKKNLL